MSWVRRIIESTDESESPTSFFYWAALTAISAVVRKNVYFDRHFYRLYPNIYVFLVARSGLKKGVPVALAKSLIEGANVTRVIAGRNSIQHVISDLSLAKSIEGGGVIKEAHGVMIASEFATFLIKNPEAMTILTDLYDVWAHEKEWKNSLQRGVESLKSPYLTLLGATNEEHFNDAIPNVQISGGFIGRTFIVYEEQRHCINDLLDKPTKLVIPEEFIPHLKAISKVKGPFGLSPRAYSTLREWYNKLCNADIHDTTGTVERLLDHVIKLSMILALSEEPTLKFHKRHVDEAIEQATWCFENTKKLTMGAGRSVSAYATKIVMKELLAAPDHQVRRDKLLQKHWGEFDAFDLDKIIETLTSANAVDIMRSGSTTFYKLKESVVQAYSKLLTEVN
jgi:hypothetical protein